VTGNSATATTLQTARTIAISGDVTGTATSFNGSANISIPVTIDNLSVTTAKIADGAVNQAKASNMLVPSGAVMAFAMNSAPTGWLAANGAAVSRTTYSNLFSTIGTTYGAGDGSTTFNLPNLSGIFVRGSGSQTIGGVSYSRSFSTNENDALQNITGTVGEFDAAFGTTVNTGAFTTTQTTKTTGGGGSGKYLTADFDASRVARTSTETRPANIALLYCIKI
jgi:microcystin-dependent protein